jgi:hypothetical protein
MTMTTRARLHELVDELSESSFDYAEVSLQKLLGAESDTFWEQLDDAPIDPEPLSPATIKRLDAARARALSDARQGRVVNARHR